MSTYDSRPATYEHIRDVAALLMGCATNLMVRAHEHDASKLEEPERSTLDEFTPKLSELTYGSDEYKASLEGMGDSLKHHYEHNPHHPEHFENGIEGMNLLDVLEMLCDWVAATGRHEDGDIRESLKINQKRFGLSDQLCVLIHNTLDYMDDGFQR